MKKWTGSLEFGRRANKLGLGESFEHTPSTMNCKRI